MALHAPLFVISLFLSIIAIGGIILHYRNFFRRSVGRHYTDGSRLLDTLRLLYWIAAAVSVMSLVANVFHLPAHGWVTAASSGLVALSHIVEIVALSTRRISTPPAPLKQSVLVVAAHPDDLEIACGGTLAKLVDRGHEVHGLIMCHGAQGGDASLRPDEAKDGANFLGLTSLAIKNLEDLNLEGYVQEMVAYIEEAILAHNPDVIITHSVNDVHQDHVAVHKATIRAGRNHHSILCMESPSVTADFKPTVFFDTTEYRQVKREAIAAHANQLDKPYMAAEIIDGITSFRGRQARLQRAEGFEVVRVQVSNVLPL